LPSIQAGGPDDLEQVTPMRGQAGDEHLPDIRRGRIGGKPIRRYQRLDLPVRKLLFDALPHPEGQAPVIICYLPRILFAQPGGKVDGRGPLPGVEQRLALAPGIEKHRLPVLRASPVHQAQVDARERIRDDLRRREAQGIFRRGSASLEVSAQRAPQHPRHIVERIILHCRFALRQKQRRPQPRLHSPGPPTARSGRPPRSSWMAAGCGSRNGRPRCRWTVTRSTRASAARPLQLKRSACPGSGSSSGASWRWTWIFTPKLRSPPPVICVTAAAYTNYRRRGSQLRREYPCP